MSSIDLEVTEVAEGGWQVAVDVTNFVFEGFDSQQHLPGREHVHVLVDGVEWGMVYEPVFTIDHFDPGQHTISVTLSSNDHMDYAINGPRITAMATVEVAGEVEEVDVTIRVEIHDGHVMVEPTEPQAAVGDIVEVIVTSHVQETVHVHGYDRCSQRDRRRRPHCDSPSMSLGYSRSNSSTRARTCSK